MDSNAGYPFQIVENSDCSPATAFYQGCLSVGVGHKVFICGSVDTAGADRDGRRGGTGGNGRPR
jgi:hypothetical protein